MSKEELKFEKLGKEERKVLFKALDIDWTNLRCQYCDEKVTYDNCGIMPQTDTEQLATITCTSPLCVSEFLNASESKRLEPCCEKAMVKAYEDCLDMIKESNDFPELKYQIALKLKELGGEDG